MTNEEIEIIIKKNFKANDRLDLPKLITFIHKIKDHLNFYIIERVTTDGHYLNEAIFDDTLKRFPVRIIFMINPLAPKSYSREEVITALTEINDHKKFLMTKTKIKLELPKMPS